MNKTKNSIRGGIITTFFTLTIMILSFTKTKILIVDYGTDINSVCQAANQIYAYLTLIESGVCAAYQFKMYSPYQNNNLRKLYSLYKGLTNTMKKVGYKMLIFILGVSFLYPLILANNGLGYFSRFFIFLLIGIRCAIPYCLIVAKKNMIVLQEKQYLCSAIDSCCTISTMLIEIVFLGIIKLPIEITLIAGSLVLIISFLIYNKMVNKFWSDKLSSDDKKSIQPSYEANKMTNDILFHQIASIINNNVDIVILSTVNVFNVTVYSNYNSIMSYPVTIISGLINNIKASIGLKFAANDKNMYGVFREILSFSGFVASIVTSVFLVMINDFITLWLGDRFTVNSITVFLFSMLLLRRMINDTIYAVRDANGLYKESKYYTLFTALCNLVLSILLVQKYQITGLLIATFLTTYFIMDLGNNYLVFKTVFNKKMWIYVDILIALTTMLSSKYVINNIFNLGTINISISLFIIKTVITTIVATLISFVLLIIIDKYFIQLIRRIKSVFIH